jgi:prepilin-type N-terminal cleavage/methylation domain-containing protein
MENQKVKNKQQGFTLVEVIVVAIIVAALAAVAVPLYLSYVKSSRINAAANTAGSVASFCGACNSAAKTLNEEGILPTGGGSITCDNNTNINIPKDIIVTYTAASTDSTGAVPGEISARHVESDSTDASATATYNF